MRFDNVGTQIDADPLHIWHDCIVMSVMSQRRSLSDKKSSDSLCFSSSQSTMPTTFRLVLNLDWSLNLAEDRRLRRCLALGSGFVDASRMNSEPSQANKPNQEHRNLTKSQEIYRNAGTLSPASPTPRISRPGYGHRGHPPTGHNLNHGAPSTLNDSFILLGLSFSNRAGTYVE